MRTAPMIGVDIHFGPDSIRHKYHPGDDKCAAYGVLKIDNGGSTYANLYFAADPAHIDKMIAELVALKQEMDPPGSGPGGVLIGPMSDAEYYDITGHTA